MTKYSKWLGGVLGWAFAGPIGGLFGFAIGSLIDATSSKEKPGQTTRGDFMMSLLVLIAAILKADGRVVRSELDFVKSYFLRSFGPEAARQMVRTLGDLIKQEIPLTEVNRQIKNNMDYPSRLQLIHLLLAISKADGKVCDNEMRLIRQIADELGVEPKDYESMQHMYYSDVNAAYKVLEIEPDATNDEVKKAYRTMAVRYHPDKVSHLGEELANSAKEKFQKINEAYEKIKKERNIV
ncbi:MAG: TerB family tellurite resistance protein [Bacteroidales bacterium]|jgi:DnaJ like chaperone protein|nr:TerB family tellurite resistance protein [Bacteroidales bacterium]